MMRTVDPQVFTTNPEALEAVSPGISMAVTLGDRFSVAVMRFVCDDLSASNPASKPHSHGEETSLILNGGAVIQLPGQEVVVEEGDLLLVGARVTHSGYNVFPPSGFCLRVNFVTPPREEYVLSKGRPYYPSALEGPKGRIASDLEPPRPVRRGRLWSDARAGSSHHDEELSADSTKVTVRHFSRHRAWSPAEVFGEPGLERVAFFLRGGCRLEIEKTIYEVPERSGILIPEGTSFGGAGTELHFNSEMCAVVLVTPPECLH